MPVANSMPSSSPTPADLAADCPKCCGDDLLQLGQQPAPEHARPARPGRPPAWRRWRRRPPPSAMARRRTSRCAGRDPDPARRSTSRVGDRRGHRHHAAAETLAGEQDVRHARPRSPRPTSAQPAEAGLDLVDDEQNAPCSAAERATRAQVAGRRDDHPGLALHRLDDHARRARRARPARRRARPRPVRTWVTVRQQRPERVLIDGIGGRLTARPSSCRGIRRSIETSRSLAAAAGHLDRGLDRLGAGPGEVHPLQPGRHDRVSASAARATVGSMKILVAIGCR